MIRNDYEWLGMIRNSKSDKMPSIMLLY
jgi:hypothetical protein